jgi:hypothetical protein
MHVFKQRFVGIGIFVFGVVAPEFDHAVNSFRLTETRSLSRSSGDKSWVSEVSTALKYAIGPMWIWLAPMAIMVAAEAHSSGTSAYQFFAVAANQVNHAQGLDAAAAIAFDENIDFVVIACMCSSKW